MKSFCPVLVTNWYEIQRHIAIKTRPLHSCIATWRYRSQRANDGSLRTDNCRTDSETENKHVGLKVLLKLNLDYCVCSVSQESLAQLTQLKSAGCFVFYIPPPWNLIVHVKGVLRRKFVGTDHSTSLGTNSPFTRTIKIHGRI